MKIIRLTAENIKKVVAVDITPDGNIVQITGKNAQGKSSVLDCIWYALGGSKDLPTQPIHAGAKSGEITLDLGDYVVTRKFTEKGSTLSVKSAKGASYPSPQSLLDKMLGDLSFDPLEFSRMKPKDQFDRLRVISGVGDQIDEIDGQIKTDFDERTNVNRDVSSLQAQVDAIIIPTGTPDEMVDVTALVAEGEQKRDENTAITEASRQLAISKGNIVEYESEIHKAEALIKRIKGQIETENASIVELIKSSEKQPHDLTDLREKVATANDVNRAVAEKQRKAILKKQLDEKTTSAEKLSESIETRRKERQKVMEEANMPVAGIALADGQIFLNEIPFSQASTAEQLKVSVAIAMAANPEIRVIRIKDGSLLDDDNMELLRTMAVDKDYQIWIECVDGSGEVGIVMEDGQVKTVNA